MASGVAPKTENTSATLRISFKQPMQVPDPVEDDLYWNTWIEVQADVITHDGPDTVFWLTGTGQRRYPTDAVVAVEIHVKARAGTPRTTRSYWSGSSSGSPSKTWLPSSVASPAPSTPASDGSWPPTHRVATKPPAHADRACAPSPPSRRERLPRLPSRCRAETGPSRCAGSPHR